MFRNYYDRLAILNFKELCPYFVTCEIITYRDGQFVLSANETSTGTNRVLDSIKRSLDANIDEIFDKFLSILERHGDSTCKILAKQMRNDLGTTGTAIHSNYFNCIRICYHHDSESWSQEEAAICNPLVNM